MVRAVDDLNQLLRAAEAQRQDSIAGQIETLLRNLEQSMTSSLEQMGSRFSESLSGSATQQFDRVAESLGGTARLLEGMNAQFQTTQSALNELINFARNSTADQMALGKTQVEELTAVLRGFVMIQMELEFSPV
jgi:methyl-accepting chemotaxis protein